MRKKLVLSIICVLCVVFSIFTLSGCSTNKGNQDASVANFVGGTSPFETLETFVTKFPDRTATQSYGLDRSKDAALWISEQFSSLGYTSFYENGLDTFMYDNGVTKRTELGYNVVYKKESPSDKVVVIGAHYDNVADVTIDGVLLGGDGTYNNGVGVATLLEVAKVLKDKDLPFDVEFVAFGAEEFGWYGSQRFLSNYSNKNNIMLMVNFDRNAIGDYVYMYSSEAKTKHNKYFYDIARQNNLCIADMPSYLSPAFGALVGNAIHINEANYADSQIFLAEGINIVNFLSMNFKPNEVVESDGKSNIAYTSDDSFNIVVERLGGREQAKQTIDKQINSAISAVVYAFESEDFVNVMSVSKANNGLDVFADSKIISYISYGLIGGSILALVIIYFVLKKRVKPHDVYINTIYGRFNTTTGEMEQKATPNNNTGDNVGNVFGEEFNRNTSNDNNFGESSNANNGNVSSGNSDKTTDIFGDF